MLRVFHRRRQWAMDEDITRGLVETWLAGGENQGGPRQKKHHSSAHRVLASDMGPHPCLDIVIPVFRVQKIGQQSESVDLGLDT